MESLETVVKKGMQKRASEAEVFCGANLLDKTNGIAESLVHFTLGSVAVFFWLLIRHAYFGTFPFRWQK